MYDLQFYLRLFFNIVLNAAVLGLEIDVSLPAAFGFGLATLVFLQWCLRKPRAQAYLHNQRMTNRMTARTYNAWDNIYSGNRYNLGLWHRDFRQRLKPRWSPRSAPSWRGKADAPGAASSPRHRARCHGLGGHPRLAATRPSSSAWRRPCRGRSK